MYYKDIFLHFCLHLCKGNQSFVFLDNSLSRKPFFLKNFTTPPHQVKIRVLIFY